MNRQLKVKTVLSVLYDLHKHLQTPEATSEKFFNKIRITCQTVFDFDLFTLFQFDYLQKNQVIMYTYGVPYNLLDAVNFRLGKGAANWIMQHKRALLISDAKRISDSEKKMVNSFLGVPIIFADYLIGTVVMGSYRPSAFAKEDQFLLELVSDYFGNLMMKSQWLPEKILEEA